MTSKEKTQLAFDEGIYANPASHTPPSASVASRRTKPASKGKVVKSPVAAQQAFLPGLSRRGRPRLKDAVPATVRAKESRQRRIEAGVKRIEFFLTPEIAADLDLLTNHYKIARVEVLGRLIAKAAKRIRQASGIIQRGGGGGLPAGGGGSTAAGGGTGVEVYPPMLTGTR